MESHSTYRAFSLGLAAACVLLALILPAGALAAPINDDLEGATKLFGADLSAGGSNLDADKQEGEPEHAGDEGGHSIWYRWAPPHDGEYRLDTCGSDFDTLLAVYTGDSVGALTPIAANDDDAGCGPQSEVVFSATAGTLYRIAIDGKGGATGSTSITVHGRALNDDLSGAGALYFTEDSATATNFFAGKQPGEPDHAGNAGGHSVWYRWTAPTAVPAMLMTCGSDFDTLLAVYTGDSVGALTPVAADDDGAACGPQSEVAFTPAAGARYWIAADGKNGAVGNLRIALYGKPANDEFAHASGLIDVFNDEKEFELGLGVTNNAIATKQPGEPNHAGVAGGHSVWYRFQPQAEGMRFVLDTCGSDFDTLLAVYTGDGVAALTPVAESEYTGYCGSHSSMRFPAPKYENGDPRFPITYWIAVDGEGGETGHVEVRLRPHPPNDGFAAALPTYFGTTVPGYNPDAGKEGGEPNHAGNAGGHSVWYRWAAPVSGPMRLDTCDSGFDTLLAVYTGDSVGALTPVADDDDGTGCGPQSELAFQASAGTSYYFAVDGKNGAVGHFFLRLTPIPMLQDNDDFMSPEALSGPGARSRLFDATTLATKQIEEPDHAGNPGGGSLWYSWTSPGAGTARIDTCKSGFDTLLAVYTGDSVGSLTPVAANDDSPGCAPAGHSYGATGSLLKLAVAPSTTYRIAVDGYDGARGNVRLNVFFAPYRVPLPSSPPIVLASSSQPAPRSKCRRGTVRRHGRCVRRLRRCGKNKVRRGRSCYARRPRCRKGKVRRHGRCVPRHMHHKGHRRSPRAFPPARP